MGKIWQQISQAVENNFWRLKTGQPEEDNKNFEFAHREYFHAKDYAAATRIDYFNTGEAAFVTNLNAGQLPADEPMWLTDIGFFVTDRKVSGAAATARAVSAVDATTMANMLLLHDMLAAGVFKLQIGSQLKYTIRGLHRLGAGGGPVISGAGTFGAAAGHFTSSNGVPATRNTFKLPRPIAIMPGQQIKAYVEFPAAIAVGAWDGACGPVLIGEAVAARSQT